MAGRPAGRAVVVVGATSGIGLATADLLVAQGDRVVLVARSPERLASVRDELVTRHDADGQVAVAAADIAEEAQVESALATCEQRFGAVDAVVTTAQPMAYGTVEQVPPEVLATMIDVAVVGVSHLARAALPRFRRQGGGQLVVVSSLLAEIAVPSLGAYCAAKWGQLGLVRALQLEVRRERGIDVSLVLPGAVDTPIYHQAATYAGSRGSAPPPVVAPEAVAQACVRCLDRPRRIVHVGVANWVTVVGYRLVPGLYERLAPTLVDRVVLRGPATGDDPGNVAAPTPDGEGPTGGWTTAGRLRTGGGRPRWRRRA